MRGKEVCRVLKEVRKTIAEQNGISLEIRECTHKGECKGTCPRCESEVQYLERELKKKRSLGKTVVLAGISAAVVAGTTGCEQAGPIADRLRSYINNYNEKEELSGMIESYTDTSGSDGEDDGIYELEGDVVYCPETEEPEELWLEGEVAYYPETEEAIEMLEGDVPDEICEE